MLPVMFVGWLFLVVLVYGTLGWCCFFGREGVPQMDSDVRQREVKPVDDTKE